MSACEEKMPRFFISASDISGDSAVIRGADVEHISRSLRMRMGEHICVCDSNEFEHDCVIEAFTRDSVTVRIVSSVKSRVESPCRITLFQALPKSDKLDFIIQKSTEIGVSRIVPFESEYCVAKAEQDSTREEKKLERRRRIALEAAKQCGRAVVPEVAPTVGFDEMLTLASDSVALFCYEGDGTVSIREKLESLCPREEYSGKRLNISIIIGSEGGFSSDEAERAAAAGMNLVGLGPRILRCETASSFVLACLAYHFEL